MVESMKPGSVIVDLAAEQGGNCSLTEPGKVVTHKGVTIIGYTDLPSRMASTASQLYGACIVALLDELQKPARSNGTEAPGKILIDLEDEVVRGAIVLHEGKMMWPPPVKERCPRLRRRSQEYRQKALRLSQPRRPPQAMVTTKAAA